MKYRCTGTTKKGTVYQISVTSKKLPQEFWDNLEKVVDEAVKKLKYKKD